MASYQPIVAPLSESEEPIIHFDAGQITGSELRPNGTKINFGCVAQADSVLKYAQPSGEWRKELCLSDELFKKDSIDTLRIVPVCTPHPKYGLKVRKGDIKGMTGSRIGANTGGTHLIVDFVVDDSSIQKRIDSGELPGLSAGYTCRHQKVMGSEIKAGIERAIREDGGGIYGSIDRAKQVLQRLDSQFEDNEVIWLQRDRRYYHLAGVKVPRAPDAQSMVSFKLDSADNTFTTLVPMPDNGPDIQPPTQKEDSKMELVAVRLDGDTVQTDSPRQVEAAQEALLQLRADNAALEAENEQLAQERIDMEEEMEDMGEKEEQYDMAYKDMEGAEYKGKGNKDMKKMYDMMRKDMERMKGKQDAADLELKKYQDRADSAALDQLRSVGGRILKQPTEVMAKFDSARDIQLAVVGHVNNLNKEQLQPYAERSDEALSGLFEQICLSEFRADSSESAFTRQQAILNGAVETPFNPSIPRQDGGTGFPMKEDMGYRKGQKDMKGGKRKKMAPLRMSYKSS